MTENKKKFDKNALKILTSQPTQSLVVDLAAIQNVLQLLNALQAMEWQWYPSLFITSYVLVELFFLLSYFVYFMLSFSDCASPLNVIPIFEESRTSPIIEFLWPRSPIRSNLEVPLEAIKITPIVVFNGACIRS